MHEKFLDTLEEMQDAKRVPTKRAGVEGDLILDALEETFIRTDADLFARIQREMERSGTRDAKSRLCRCNFFLEDPCTCLSAPITANEGSTATVVLVMAEKIYVANVGDSDAVIVSSEGEDEDEEAQKIPSIPSLVSRSEEDLLFDDIFAPTSSSSSSSSISSFLTGSFGSTAATATTQGLQPSSRKLEKITVTDTPLRDERNEDYRRIRRVAGSRARPPPVHRDGRPRTTLPPADGILESTHGERYNYVSIPGSRALNMVRAFGNFGNKTMSEEGKIVESESAIIARPHVNVVKRDGRMRAIVIGSDGLWDNVRDR